MLDALVVEQATEAEVVRRTGMTFEVHQRGTPDWEALLSYLNSEPPSRLQPLREAVTKYPRILYHTTAWEMTWVFIDDSGIIRGYWLNSQ